VEQSYSSAAGRSLGVSSSLIERWKRELHVQEAVAFSGSNGHRTT